MSLSFWTDQDLPFTVWGPFLILKNRISFETSPRKYFTKHATFGKIPKLICYILVNLSLKIWPFIHPFSHLSIFPLLFFKTWQPWVTFCLQSKERIILTFTRRPIFRHFDDFQLLSFVHNFVGNFRRNTERLPFFCVNVGLINWKVIVLFVWLLLNVMWWIFCLLVF